MRQKLFLILGVLAVFVVFGAVGMAAAGLSSTPATVGSTPGDISGPCDEAEHANDPRCSGVVDPTGDPSDGPNGRADDDGPGDISGPCDEAEHANDPRCNGVATGGGNRGPDGGHEDSQGPSENQGPGDDGNHGPGGGHDDDGDDHGGHDGPDDDHGGHGPGGDDDGGR